MTEGTTDHEHLVVFLDLLGFSEVIRSGFNEKYENVLGLLRSMSKTRRDFFVKRVTESSSKMSPAVSTFSDNIVISYDLTEMNRTSVSTLVALSAMGSMVNSIAGSALEAGFLIRGGLSIGRLFHADGVVFGPALIEAYQIESRVAVFPRVVAANSVLKNEAIAKGLKILVEDRDGLYRLPYLIGALKAHIVAKETFLKEYRRRFELVTRLVDENTAELARTGNLSALSKWRWLGSELKEVAARINSEFDELAKLGYA